MLLHRLKKVAFAVNMLKRLVCGAKAFNLSSMLTASGKLSGFKFWSTVNLMHVDSNSLPQQRLVLDNVLSDSVE